MTGVTERFFLTSVKNTSHQLTCHEARIGKQKNKQEKLQKKRDCWRETSPLDWVYKNCHKSFNATPLLWLSEQGARSLARIKVSAFGAGDRGFKSHRARSIFNLVVITF